MEATEGNTRRKKKDTEEGKAEGKEGSKEKNTKGRNEIDNLIGR